MRDRVSFAVQAAPAPDGWADLAQRVSRLDTRSKSLDGLVAPAADFVRDRDAKENGAALHRLPIERRQLRGCGVRRQLPCPTWPEDTRKSAACEQCLHQQRSRPVGGAGHFTEDLELVPDTLGIGERWRAEQAQRYVSPTERDEAIASLVEIMRVLTDVANELTIGEMRQLGAVDALGFSEQDYFHLIRAKTASLIAGACESGAMCGAPEFREALAKYGDRVGMAFQIADDILDYMGNESVTGKPVGLDLREHKVTLPLIAALPRVSAAGPLSFNRRRRSPTGSRNRCSTGQASTT